MVSKKWKLIKDEVCYRSEDDDQSYGMWCPIAIVCGDNKEEDVILMAKAPELLRVLKDLVAECPIHLSCDDFHHSSKDWHDVGEPCPPLNRYSKALRDAEKILEAV